MSGTRAEKEARYVKYQVKARLDVPALFPAGRPCKGQGAPKYIVWVGNYTAGSRWSCIKGVPWAPALGDEDEGVRVRADCAQAIMVQCEKAGYTHELVPLGAARL